MKIEHIAIWTNDLEQMREFYIKFFAARCSEKYSNPKKNFASYFLSFESGARIELMQDTRASFFFFLIKKLQSKKLSSKFGLSHFAISVGSKNKVNSLTNKIKTAGYSVLSEPRTTGDGYYESVVADPEGNLIEITS